MTVYNISLFFFACCTFLVAILVWLKRNDDIGKTFLVFSIFVTGWGIFASWMINNETPYDFALFAIRVGDGIAAVLIPPSWLHFVFTYLGKAKKKRKLIGCLYIYSLVIACFAFSPWFIPKIKPIAGFAHYTHPGVLFHFFSAAFFLSVTYGFYELAISLKSQTLMQRRQTWALMIATLCGFVPGGLSFFLIYDIPVPQYGMFIMPLYPFIMAYAIMKQGLMDPEEVLAFHRNKLALLGTMSSSIVHEIKNPLFLIQGYTEKIKMSGNQSSEITKLSEQVNRMNTLVKRLSDFGRVNPHPGTPEEVDIAQTLDDALFFAEQELKHHNIEVVKKIEPNLPKLKGDKSQFEEIFLNLIINAFHAMKDGGTLTISAKSEIRNPKSEITVVIQDSGCGIPKENLKNIFKPFYSTKGKQGTGLGLHIVKTLVEQNGGKISVESEVGKGTQFNLLFNTELRA